MNMDSGAEGTGKSRNFYQCMRIVLDDLEIGCIVDLVLEQDVLCNYTFPHFLVHFCDIFVGMDIGRILPGLTMRKPGVQSLSTIKDIVKGRSTKERQIAATGQTTAK